MRRAVTAMLFGGALLLGACSDDDFNNERPAADLSFDAGAVDLLPDLTRSDLTGADLAVADLAVVDFAAVDGGADLVVPPDLVQIDQ